MCLASAQNGLKTAIVIRIMGSKNLISERHMNWATGYVINVENHRPEPPNHLNQISSYGTSVQTLTILMSSPFQHTLAGDRHQIRLVDFWRKSTKIFGRLLLQIKIRVEWLNLWAKLLLKTVAIPLYNISYKMLVVYLLVETNEEKYYGPRCMPNIT